MGLLTLIADKKRQDGIGGNNEQNAVSKGDAQHYLSYCKL